MSMKHTLPKGMQHQMTITISLSLYKWLQGSILCDGNEGETPESVVEKMAWSLRDSEGDHNFGWRLSPEELKRFDAVAEKTGLTVRELEGLGGIKIVEKYERALKIRPLHKVA